MASDATPLVLAFDTSAAHCAAALCQGPEPRAHRAEPMARGQAERLLPLLEEVLAAAGAGWADLDAIAVGTGPGNFTGIRLSVAAARGLALALDRPAIGVSLFEALAHGRPGPVLVLAENRRGAPFAQAFRDGVPLAPPVTGLEALPPLDPATLCLGFNAAEAAGSLGLHAGAEASLADPRAIAAAAMGRIAPDAPRPVPLYLRPADAAPSSVVPPVLLDAEPPR